MMFKSGYCKDLHDTRTFTVFQTLAFFLCQGGLDIMYLKNRFELGKSKVDEKLEVLHKMVCHKSINLSHADIVEKQAKLGPRA